jgi:hypothetical protein
MELPTHETRDPTPGGGMLRTGWMNEIDGFRSEKI